MLAISFCTTVSLCVVKVTLSRRKTQVGLHCGAWCWEGKGMRGSSGQVRPPASLGGNKAPCPPSCLGRWQQAGVAWGGKPCRGGSWGPVSKARRLPAAYHRVPPPTCVHSDLWLLIVPPLLVNCTPSLTIEKTPTICHFDFKNSPTLLNSWLWQWPVITRLMRVSEC